MLLIGTCLQAPADPGVSLLLLLLRLLPLLLLLLLLLQPALRMPRLLVLLRLLRVCLLLSRLHAVARPCTPITYIPTCKRPGDSDWC